MNTTQPSTRPATRPATRLTRPRKRILALTLAGAALLAACGDDSDDSAADTAPPTTETMTTDAMTDDTMTTEPMTDDTMTTEPMTSDSMAPDDMGEMMGATGPGCAAVPADGAGSFEGMAADPAATAASNNPVLSTLVSAVQQAGLVDTLNGEGPFTIFAPTNDAFAAIPADQLNAVLADQELLTSILTLHVIAGQELSSADLIAAGEAVSVNGQTLTFTEGMHDDFMVNGATAVCMDVHTANATVHIIDTVLLPE